MKKVFAFLVLFMLLNTLKAYATERINIEVLDFRHFDIVNDVINGSFEIQNTTNVHEENLFYTLSLVPTSVIEGNSMLNVSSLSSYKTNPIKFSLTANEKKTIVFNYPLPSSLYADSYTLLLNFCDKTSTFSANSALDSFKLGSASGALIPSDYSNTHYYKIKGFEFPLSGPYFNQGKSPTAFISLKSTFSEDITVTPRFTIYKMQPGFINTPVDISFGKPVTFKPSEEKEISLSLPVITSPDSYFIKVSFLDSLNIPVSYEYFFRYVVKGENAKISSISTVYSESDKTLKVNIGILGAADGTTSLSNTTFSTYVVDPDTNSYIERYTETFELPSISYEFSYKIKIKESGKPLKIIAQLTRNNVILAYDSVSLSKEATSTITPILSDIEGSSCERAVKMLNSLNIISGYPDGTFRSSNNITRAEFAAIVMKLKGVDLTQAPVSSCPFNDIPANYWAKNLISLAHEQGVITGYDDGTFRPMANITYNEAITILLNVAGFKSDAELVGSTWPDNYIELADSLDLLKYVALPPLNLPATRSNIAIIAMSTYFIRKV